MPVNTNSVDLVPGEAFLVGELGIARAFVRSHLLVHARRPVDGTRPEKAGLLRLHREIHP